MRALFLDNGRPPLAEDDFPAWPVNVRHEARRRRIRPARCMRPDDASRLRKQSPEFAVRMVWMSSVLFG